VIATTTQLLSSGEFCKLRYDTIPLKSASANVSFYTSNSKMPNFELWPSCCKWAIFDGYRASFDYGTDGPGIESRWGAAIFRARPNRPWGPPSLLYIGYRVFTGGKVRPGRAADHSPPFLCRGHGRVQLYRYPPSGPHRARNGITLILPSCTCKGDDLSFVNMVPYS
jgi:hypothetical protein